MQRIDVIIIAALLVAVAGSAYGVLTYEDDRAPSLSVRWVTEVTSVSSPTIAQTGGGDAETAFDVALRNITRADVNVTIAGAPARLQPVALRVELIVPGVNETVTAEGQLPIGPTASVVVPLTIDIAAVPDADQVRGSSLDAAREGLDRVFGSGVGIGNWTVRVSLAPQTPGPVAETFSISAEASIVTYSADITLATPEAGPR